MPEKEKPESKKFLCQMPDIQEYMDLIENEKKGLTIPLLGTTDENIYYNEYAMLLFNLPDEKFILETSTNTKKNRLEICSMVADLINPEYYDFSSVGILEIDKELRCKLMSDCVFLSVPIAMIALGESEITKQKMADLYVLGDNSPEEVYASIWNYANDSLRGNNSTDFSPNNGQLN
jgi:hypothetical protein